MRRNNSTLIKLCYDKFEYRYSYTEVDPEGAITLPSKIFCPYHGYFEQPLSQHYNSKTGCKQCANDKRKKGKNYYLNLINEQDFGIYSVDTSKVENRTSRITLHCPIHGDSETSVSSFLNGCRCKMCGRVSSRMKQRKSTPERISEFKSVHGDLYDYSLLPPRINSNKSKVKIICKVHGVFEQRVNDHMSGKGCRSCSKAGCDKAYIHLIKDGERPLCIKYGIAKNVKRRLSELCTSTPYDVVNIYEFLFENSEDCHKAEDTIKKELTNVMSRNEMKDGWSETCEIRFVDYVVGVFSSFGGVRV